MSSLSKSNNRKLYKPQRTSSQRDMTDTEFYKDVEGGDPHKSPVLKKITG